MINLMPIQKALVKLSKNILMINVNRINGNIFSVLVIAFFKFSFAKIIINKFTIKNNKINKQLAKKNIAVG